MYTAYHEIQSATTVEASVWARLLPDGVTQDDLAWIARFLGYAALALLHAQEFGVLAPFAHRVAPSKRSLMCWNAHRIPSRASRISSDIPLCPPRLFFLLCSFLAGVLSPFRFCSPPLPPLFFSRSLSLLYGTRGGA
jgi:hypothetical protein